MKLKKLINIYLAIQLLVLIIMGVALTAYNVDAWLWIVVIASAFASFVVALSMGNVEWHKTREEMIEDQKESTRMVNNVNKLIDQTKRQLFKQNIMTKEEVGEILDRTYEETLMDK